MLHVFQNLEHVIDAIMNMYITVHVFEYELDLKLNLELYKKCTYQIC